MAKRFVSALITLAFWGCATPQPQLLEVKVPVPTMPAVPAELTAPLPSAPAFVSPTHPDASSALTPAGEQQLKLLLLELDTRLRAWQVWAE